MNLYLEKTEKIMEKIVIWYKNLMLVFFGLIIGVLIGAFYEINGNNMNSFMDFLFNYFLIFILIGVLILILKIIFHHKKKAYAIKGNGKGNGMSWYLNNNVKTKK